MWRGELCEAAVTYGGGDLRDVFQPIVHAADVKPYASDLLAALIILAIAVEWSWSPDQSRWIWAMAAMAPLALALSHPAIFIATGNLLAFAPAVAKIRPTCGLDRLHRLRPEHASAFLVLYFVFTRAQAAANLTAMQTQWAAAFPPLGDHSA